MKDGTKTGGGAGELESQPTWGDKPVLSIGPAGARLVLDDQVDESREELRALKQRLEGLVLELELFLSRGWLSKVSRLVTRMVCEEFGVSYVGVHSRNRTERLMLPRHVVWTLIEQLTGAHPVEIGAAFGKGYHRGAVKNAWRQVKNRMETDAHFATVYRRLEQRCTEAVGELLAERNNQRKDQNDQDQKTGR